MVRRHPNTECSVCGEPLYRRPSDLARNTRSFCTNCYDPAGHLNTMSLAASEGNRRKYLRYIKRWKDGREDGIRKPSGISGHIRRYLFDRADHKCEKCGWAERNEFTGRIPLEVNHIDGDYKNNIESNLELLCPNCHTLTEFHGSRNKGRGRPR